MNLKERVSVHAVMLRVSSLAVGGEHNPSWIVL